MSPMTLSFIITVHTGEGTCSPRFHKQNLILSSNLIPLVHCAIVCVAAELSDSIGEKLKGEKSTQAIKWAQINDKRTNYRLNTFSRHFQMNY